MSTTDSSVKTKSTGVVVARFQTPFLHPGHRELLDGVQARHNKVVLVLGVSPLLGTRRNPYDFHTREKMVKKSYPDIVVLPLSDHPSDETWSQNLDNLLGSTFPGERFLLYGSRDSFIQYYAGRMSTEELPASGDYNATTIRESLSDKVMDSADFRAGILYAYSNGWPKVFATVDVALFRNEGAEVLLGKKPTQQGWRFPGGFTDPTDDNFEAAARRELTEEVGQVETGPLTYVCSQKIDDWRYRREQDKIITSLYRTDLVYGNPEGSDDLERVEWFPVAGLQAMLDQGQIVYEHIPLVRTLVQRLADTAGKS